MKKIDPEKDDLKTMAMGEPVQEEDQQPKGIIHILSNFFFCCRSTTSVVEPDKGTEKISTNFKEDELVQFSQALNSGKKKGLLENSDSERGGTIDKPIISKEEFMKLSVIKIQGLIRIFLARVEYSRRLKEAVASFENYLAGKNGEVMAELRRLEEIKKAKAFFVSNYCESLLSGAVLFFQATLAAITLQRVWRGYIIRKKYPIPPRKMRWKRPIYIPRYGPDVYRRLWAQRYFTPVGDWPGVRAPSAYYDMWTFANKPPKGRSYGIRTRKILAGSKGKVTGKILINDKHAWVGFPTALKSQEELKPSPSRLEIELQSSPLAFKTLKQSKYEPDGGKFDPFKEEVRRRQKLRILQRSNLRIHDEQSQISQGVGIPSQTFQHDDKPTEPHSFTTSVGDVKKSGNWYQKFKRLFVTPLRGSKPLPLTHKVAVEGPYRGKMGKTDSSLSQHVESTGAITRMLLKSIESEKFNSIPTFNNDKRERLSNLIDLEVSSTSNCALSTIPVSTIDHAMLKIGEEKLKRKALLPVYDSNWHKEFDKKGEFVGYIRKDTGERWSVYYDDFGKQYFVNSITSESSWTAPQNPSEEQQHDKNVILEVKNSGNSDNSILSSDVNEKMQHSESKSIKPIEKVQGRIDTKHYKESIKPFIDDSISTVSSLARGTRLSDGSYHFERNTSVNAFDNRESRKPNNLIAVHETSNEELETSTKLEGLKGSSNAFKTSPWMRLKEATSHLIEQVMMLNEVEQKRNLELNIPIRKKKEIKSKARVWYARPKRHFEMKYSWLPQPLIGKAAARVRDKNLDSNMDSMSLDDSFYFKSSVVDDTDTIASQGVARNTDVVRVKKKPVAGRTSTFTGFMSQFIAKKTKEMRGKGDIHSSKFVVSSVVK